MATSAQLCREITAGRWDEALGALYGAQQLQRQRARYCAALEQFELYFGPVPSWAATTPTTSMATALQRR